jgi:uncharacterized membrane protein YhaH (DUF805 family)
MNRRVWVLIGVLAAAVLVVFLLPPIPQNEAYHNFADQRSWLGISNCLDVISNVPFLIVGLWGLFALSSRNAPASRRLLDARERLPYLVFFLGVALTAFGSSYYHLAPGDSRLVWDRLPMTVGFMGLLSAMIAERISVRTGLRALAPLVLFGLASVFYWRITEQAGRGDLRPYALVQFGSMLAILLLVLLFPPRYTRGADLVVSFLIYGLKKRSKPPTVRSLVSAESSAATRSSISSPRSLRFGYCSCCTNAVPFESDGKRLRRSPALASIMLELQFVFPGGRAHGYA